MQFLKGRNGAIQVVDGEGFGQPFNLEKRVLVHAQLILTCFSMT
jgi:hypothetical protein